MDELKYDETQEEVMEGVDVEEEEEVEEHAEEDGNNSSSGNYERFNLLKMKKNYMYLVDRDDFDKTLESADSNSLKK
jgi:hypothetical protein